MAELLLEFFSEEIPARMQEYAEEHLTGLLLNRLQEAGFNELILNTFSTPQRLIAVVGGLPLVQPTRIEELRGPRLDAPAAAIEGFLKSNELTRADCTERTTPKGVFLIATVTKQGKPVTALLPTLVQEIIQDFSWPKSMTWSYTSQPWVRPLHHVVCVFDGVDIPFPISLNNVSDTPPVTIQSSNTTRGHRFLAPAYFTVNSFTDYKQKLHQAFVIIDRSQRRTTIKEQSEHLAQKLGVSVFWEAAPLEEIVGLVEWPVAFVGQIDTPFMKLPPELLTMVMRTHQRYIPLQTKEGILAPHFILIANIPPQDKGNTLIHGNERVLRARFSDAQFFWETDRQKPLATYAEHLHKRVFHAQLGSLGDRTARLIALAGYLAELLQYDKKTAIDAALLAKADLMTTMVSEFPELQGIMGSYYALADGASPEIATAIRDHYRAGIQEDKAWTRCTKILALADRLDLLVGFFRIGIQPTGSKDPYGLRRAALASIRLILSEPTYDLSLEEIIGFAYDLYEGTAQGTQAPRAETIATLRTFIYDRLKVLWRETGLRHDWVQAVLAKSEGISLTLLERRVQALADFLQNENGKHLLTAYRRARNIVQAETKKESESYSGVVNPEKLSAQAAESLYKTLQNVREQIDIFLAKKDFIRCMEELADLRPLIDQFFDQVTVNAEDISVRLHRLRLLSLIQQTIELIADFSQIEG